MNAIVKLVVVLGGVAAGGCASTGPAPDPSVAVDAVHFSAISARGKFTITCRPQTDAIGRSPAWVDSCEELGRRALEDAVRNGLIAPVEDPAFGVASEVMRSMRADAPVSSKVISRDVPLIGTAL